MFPCDACRAEQGGFQFVEIIFKAKSQSFFVKAFLTMLGCRCEITMVFYDTMMHYGIGF